MKYAKYLMVFVSLVGFQAQAEVVTCSFTEPFFWVQFDSKNKTLILVEPDWEGGAQKSVERTLSKNATVKLKQVKKISDVRHVPVYSVVEGKKELMSFELSFQGSDSMSPLVYPYDGKIFFNGAIQQGGCETDALPSFVVEDVEP